MTDDALPRVLRDTMVALVRRGDPHLTVREIATFLTCYLGDGPHTPRALAAALHVSKPVITRALDRLEGYDLVQRAPDPRDRRSVLIKQTWVGDTFLRELKKILDAGGCCPAGARDDAAISAEAAAE